MTVRKRGGTWYFDFMIRRARYREAVPEARTKHQAEQAEAQARLAVYEGRYGRRPGSADLTEFIEETYLPWSRASKLSWRDDRTNARVIKVYFAGKTFNQISPMLVEKFKHERARSVTVRGTVRCPASVNRELATLSRIFTMATDNGLAETNPCRRVKRLRQDNERSRYLSFGRK